ncbi:MAG: hypothetical protein A2286_01990 [Gammaproteobacteria bacterium RIFOXYA12_FULL_61_12]|nr:MAG: hypothetical protein A2514_07945 [Gammaproteobacteria bacterium RIFOXYD12_FULL_61_37]OGT93814.1 MAG: hypothetical protein A2286_01990 [Gammaproteobacteria bacterium RIFOXYA12_FULL_61_12]
MANKNNTVQILSRLFLLGAREAAAEDIEAAQIQFGVPVQFLERLLATPLDRVCQIVDSITVLPFQPRLPRALLMRMLDEPQEVNNAAVILGARNASAIN